MVEKLRLLLHHLTLGVKTVQHDFRDRVGFDLNELLRVGEYQVKSKVNAPEGTEKDAIVNVFINEGGLMFQGWECEGHPTYIRMMSQNGWLQWQKFIIKVPISEMIKPDPVEENKNGIDQLHTNSDGNSSEW